MSPITIDFILSRPIPDQLHARQRMKHVDEQPLFIAARNDEPIVDLSRYGVAGKSREGHKPVLVRQTVAERLSDINFALQQSVEAQQFFGRKVELYVEEGWRLSASHASGATISTTLRSVREDQGFVEGSLLPMGSPHTAKELDYFEHNEKLTAAEALAKRNRRAFYWIMRGALQSDDSDFVCDPDAWWQWSFGDQMWAACTEAPYAFFGPTTP